MLGLPQKTEIHKMIPKKKVYEVLQDKISPERKKSFDSDISRMTLVNELSEVSLNLAGGEKISSIFVILINLREKDYDPKNFSFLSHLFGQNVLMVLEFEGKYRLAIYETRLLCGDWEEEESLKVSLSGLDLDKVWENLVLQVSGVRPKEGQGLDESLKEDERKKKLEKKIAQLDKKARAEKQPRSKYEYFKEMEELKKELEGLNG